MKKRQLTIKDIAKALQISPSTVSRSLADHPDISDETKAMVNRYAREHKYKPNALATSLRTNKNKAIGVILPQIVHFYFSSVLSGIEDVAEKRGYRIIVSHSNEEYSKEVKGAQVLQEARVCGVLASVAKSTEQYDHFLELIDSDIPVVFFDRICTGILTDRVVVDDYAGALSAVDYLIKTGCRRIALLGSTTQLAISNNRRMGYEDALRKNGLPVDPNLMIMCDNFNDALDITPRLLSIANPPDAFFAVNDETAIGVMNAVKSFGLRIPDDVSVCGFTNNSITEFCDPTLTSVDQHGYEVGETAMSLLIDRIEGKRMEQNIVSKIIKTKLVVRGSTR
ncbi:LacI family transcriptional regulator [Parabacteroides sp. OttesenSCG-928-N08]|nr:LacI family transcriptional regulator [Parabacteroides sp. OttesenSCG-928-N08]